MPAKQDFLRNNQKWEILKMNRLFLQAIPFCNILIYLLYIFIFLERRQTLDKSMFSAFKPYIFGVKAYIFGV
ncbi:hypothetical protein A7K69_16330 [Parageobacillus thermoglucosidasius]|uniref:Uncharacterized protein n=1 Tax=Parageobacillus thermoglucosidasius TaxID=1426 RepID=A0A1B7KVR4_PARTM|nr:hypothetical protein A7K69_16330 [Parageobacillus thermoglucosidasius]